jgi:hypothetical protein
MSQKTYSALRLFVQNKLDLRDEDFIDDAEILEYTEEALKYCEAEVHKLGIEDQYFVAHAPITLVNGKFDYALPSNIYGNKILKALYSNGTFTTPLKRVTDSRRFERSEDVRKYGTVTSGEYGYMLVNNDIRQGTRMRLYPTPTESSTTLSTTGTVATTAVLSALGSTSGVAPGWFVSGASIASGTLVQTVDSGTQVTMSAEGLAASVGETITFTEPRLQVWYIRRVAIPTADTDMIDFPEFWHFVAQHVVVNCLKKEVGNSRLQVEAITLEEYRKQMLETLTNMVPDQDTMIEQDLSFSDWSMTHG